MAIDELLANALEDLTLDPIAEEGDTIEDALTAGYAMPEAAASFGPPPICCCSCCC